MHRKSQVAQFVFINAKDSELRHSSKAVPYRSGSFAVHAWRGSSCKKSVISISTQMSAPKLLNLNPLTFPQWSSISPSEIGHPKLGLDFQLSLKFSKMLNLITNLALSSSWNQRSYSKISKLTTVA